MGAKVVARLVVSYTMSVRVKSYSRIRPWQSETANPSSMLPMTSTPQFQTHFNAWIIKLSKQRHSSPSGLIVILWSNSPRRIAAVWESQHKEDWTNLPGCRWREGGTSQFTHTLREGDFAENSRSCLDDKWHCLGCAQNDKVSKFLDSWQVHKWRWGISQSFRKKNK